jgi:hypothetical protein
MSGGSVLDSVIQMGPGIHVQMHVYSTAHLNYKPANTPLTARETTPVCLFDKYVWRPRKRLVSGCA